MPDDALLTEADEHVATLADRILRLIAEVRRLHALSTPENGERTDGWHLLRGDAPEGTEAAFLSAVRSHDRGWRGVERR